MGLTISFLLPPPSHSYLNSSEEVHPLTSPLPCFLNVTISVSYLFIVMLNGLLRIFAVFPLVKLIDVNVEKLHINTKMKKTWLRFTNKKHNRIELNIFCAIKVFSEEHRLLWTTRLCRNCLKYIEFILILFYSL
jgi:uncharacterized ubiquitin-like protein YukD